MDITEDLSLKKTELNSLDKPPVNGQKLPFDVRYHSGPSRPKYYLPNRWNCGIQHRRRTNKSCIIDPMNNFAIRKGPALNQAKHKHSCNKMKINGKIILVVVSGWYKNRALDSVELLDTTSTNQGWIKGMHS